MTDLGRLYRPLSISRFVSPALRTAVPFFLVCMLTALPGFVVAQTARVSGTARFDAQLESIVKRVLPPNYAVSVQVVDLESGAVLMEKNPDLPLVPASTLKAVTSATALKTLKPDFAFVTEVLAEQVEGASVGNIALKGKGDPYLVSEQLFALTRALRDKGLREVRGNIIVDDSYFIPSKPLDEAENLGPRSYHAPYAALSLNFNTVKVVVLPADRAGKAAKVLVDPVSEYVILKADVKTVPGNAAPRLSYSKESVQDGREVIRVSGTIGVSAPPKGKYVNVAAPAVYAGEVFKEFLLREGIRVVGKVVYAKTPPDAAPYLEFQSRPLGTIVYWLNKFSNNFMAEQICLGLGATVHGAPGTREKGLSVIRKYLLECGVDEGCFSLSEASGLSRANRLSASALVKVLLAASRDFTYNAEYQASFGIAGADGTLREKFTDPSVRRRLRAKTGTLRGVNALAGYGISPNGRLFAFAVLVNSLRNGAGLVAYADEIMKAILDLPLPQNQGISPQSAQRTQRRSTSR